MAHSVAINTPNPKDAFGAKIPQLPGFDDCVVAGLDASNTVVSIKVTYTHEPTGTELHFAICPGDDRRTIGKYVVSAYRSRSEQEHSVYVGRNTKLVQPVKEPGDKQDFASLYNFTAKLLDQALETIDLDVIGVTECAVASAVDGVVDKYHELLRENIGSWRLVRTGGWGYGHLIVTDKDPYLYEPDTK